MLHRNALGKYAKKANDYRIVNETVYIDVSTPKHPNAEAEIDLLDLHYVIDGNGRWHVREASDGRLSISRGRAPGQSLSLHLLKPKSGVADHANGNTFDNKRNNLREATHAQNSANRRAVGKFGFKGVDKPPRGGFRVDITVNGTRQRFGSFATAEEAAKAYDVAAIAAWGEFACTNASMGLI